MSTRSEINLSKGFEDLSSFKIFPEMAQLLSMKYCKEKKVILLGDCPKSLDAIVPLGMLDITRDDLVKEIEQENRFTIRRIQLNEYEIEKAIKIGFEDNENQKLEFNADHEKIELKADHKITFEEGQSVSKMIVSTFSQAVQQGASDIHIETYESDIDIRFRIDGELKQIVTPLSRGNIKQITSYIKILSDLDITETRKAQDARIETAFTNDKNLRRQIDLRVNILPGPYGEDIVLRILDENRINFALEDLGMKDDIHLLFSNAINTPGGTVLVTGPTASGKTTTLYAGLKTINTNQNKILTVEDPIEYSIEKVNQKQITQHMGFADYGRAFMRQNPDIIFLGEIRDEETANIAFRASQTGHMVLSTLHTRTAKSTINRLLALNTDPSLIATCLEGVLNQRLVRKNCLHCTESYLPEHKDLEKIIKLPNDINFKKGKGCPKCDNTGYKGQIGVFEFLKIDGEVRNHIYQHPNQPIKSPKGFEPMFLDALDKVKAGITSLEEIIKHVPQYS